MTSDTSKESSLRKLPGLGGSRLMSLSRATMSFHAVFLLWVMKYTHLYADRNSAVLSGNVVLSRRFPDFNRE